MENDMDIDRFQVITSPTRADYRDLVRGLNKTAWPEFMLHDQVANELWHELLDRFPEYQLALYDTENNRVAAMGNSFPIRWEDALEALPEGGWDWAFEEAVKDHKQGLSPNYHCAIQVVIHSDYRGHRLSPPMIEAVRAVTKAKGLQALIIPVRPSEKSKYPLISMADYLTWKNEEGLPFDAWLRVHARLGGKIIKTCHESKTIRGTRAEWEAWTMLKFPQSGEYIIPDALVPMEMNVEKDEGIYVEPNVWMLHPLKQP
jgi:GNAT superfamily N-acetyltransferase